MAAPNPEAQMPLPPRIQNAHEFPVLPQQSSILVNAFKMDLSNIVPKAFLFDLKFFAFSANRQNPQGAENRWELWKDERNDIDVQIRRRLLWHLFELLFELDPGTFQPQYRPHYIYDCRNLMFCSDNIGFEVNQEWTIQIGRQHLDGLPAELLSHPDIRNAIRVEAVVLRTEMTLNLRNELMQNEETLIQMLEILISQRIMQLDEHLIFGSVIFSQAQIPLRGMPAFVLNKGLQKNVRLVLDSEQQIRAILQIRPKKAAFISEISLREFLCHRMNLNPNELANRLANGEMREEAESFIKGLSLITTHSNLTFKLAGLTPERAEQLYFLHEGHRVNVVQYMEQRYGQRVNPALPCVIRKRGRIIEHFPIELLKILPGQRVKGENQSKILAQQMIRECQILPVHMGNQIQEKRAEIGIDNNQFLEAFGIRVENMLIVTKKVHRLIPPAIKYDRACIEPNDRGELNWRTRDKRYIAPTNMFPNGYYAVVVFNQCVTRNERDHFLNKIVQEAGNKGIPNVGLPEIRDDWTEPRGGPLKLFEYVKKQHDRLCTLEIQFVLLIAPGKNVGRPKDIHHCLKLMETFNNPGILTQHVAPETVRNFIKGEPTTVENILMKMNLKMDGANYDLVASQQLLQANRGHGNRDIVKEGWLNPRRMFLGLEFSHAPPNTLPTMVNKKGKKVPAIPTVVGMAWTIGDDWVLRMRGTFTLQTPRLTIANDEECRPLIEKFKEALGHYHKENERYPEQIFVFRGGVSEGEFKKVAYWEGQQSFERALEELRNVPEGSDMPRLEGNPQIFIVVCQAKSNYRIVPTHPKGDRAPQQNVQPGTVMEHFTHPNLTEFILVAHKALQGTAQPIRCTLVYPPFEDARSPPVSLLELEYLTYHLCYSHGICPGSIALPGPLKAASELAKRGKNNWDTNPFFPDKIDCPDIEEEDDPQQEFDAKLDDLFRGQSSNIEPNIPTKFWA